jgi:hypothetical protein
VTAQKAKEIWQAANVKVLSAVLGERTFPIPEAIYRNLQEPTGVPLRPGPGGAFGPAAAARAKGKPLAEGSHLFYFQPFLLQSVRRSSITPGNDCRGGGLLPPI